MIREFFFNFFSWNSFKISSTGFIFTRILSSFNFCCLFNSLWWIRGPWFTWMRSGATYFKTKSIIVCLLRTIGAFYFRWGGS